MWVYGRNRQIRLNDGRDGISWVLGSWFWSADPAGNPVREGGGAVFVFGNGFDLFWRLRGGNGNGFGGGAGRRVEGAVDAQVEVHGFVELAIEAGELAIEEVEGAGVVGEVFVGLGGECETFDVLEVVEDVGLGGRHIEVLLLHLAAADLLPFDLDDLLIEEFFGVGTRSELGAQGGGEGEELFLVLLEQEGIGQTDDRIAGRHCFAFRGPRTGGFGSVGPVGGELTRGQGLL